MYTLVQKLRKIETVVLTHVRKKKKRSGKNFTDIKASKCYITIFRLLSVVIIRPQDRNTVPREALKYRKNALLWDLYFLIRHNPGITKIPK